MKWSMRKSGHMMGTFRVRVHVPKEMVDFLQEHCEWSQKAALEWIRDHWKLMDGYDVLMVGDGEPEIIAEMEIQTSIGDGYIPYEGPEIITST